MKFPYRGYLSKKFELRPASPIRLPANCSIVGQTPLGYNVHISINYTFMVPMTNAFRKIMAGSFLVPRANSPNAHSCSLGDSRPVCSTSMTSTLSFLLRSKNAPYDPSTQQGPGMMERFAEIADVNVSTWKCKPQSGQVVNFDFTM